MTARMIAAYIPIGRAAAPQEKGKSGMRVIRHRVVHGYPDPRTAERPEPSCRFAAPGPSVACRCSGLDPILSARSGI